MGDHGFDGGRRITRSRSRKSKSRCRNVTNSMMTENGTQQAAATAPASATAPAAAPDMPVFHSSYSLRSGREDTDTLKSQANILKVSLVVEMEREGKPPMQTTFDLGAKNLGANSDLESLESIKLEDISLGLRLRLKRRQTNELNTVVWKPVESSSSSMSEMTLSKNYFTINWTSLPEFKTQPWFKFKLSSKLKRRPKTWNPYFIFASFFAVGVFLSLYGSFMGFQETETTLPFPSNE